MCCKPHCTYESTWTCYVNIRQSCIATISRRMDSDLAKQAHNTRRNSCCSPTCTSLPVLEPVRPSGSHGTSRASCAWTLSRSNFETAWCHCAACYMSMFLRVHSGVCLLTYVCVIHSPIFGMHPDTHPPRQVHLSAPRKSSGLSAKTNFSLCLSFCWLRGLYAIAYRR